MLLDEASVVVVMPVHDEEGLAGFLLEIDDFLLPLVGELRYVLVDDFSSAPVLDAVQVLPAHLLARIDVRRHDINLGHGPSVLHAYRAGLALAPTVVLHVDGDGQFSGRDMPQLVATALEHGAAVGQRHSRQDPWFRAVISWVARRVVDTAPSLSDVNSPLRAYRPCELVRLLDEVPARSLVPHLHFSRLHESLGIHPVGQRVRSLPRRGASATGTTWGRHRRALPSSRTRRRVRADL